MDLINNLNIEKNSNISLCSNLGNVVNTAIDNGLRIILPDFIEDDIIDIKNSFVEGGFPEMINSVVEKSINIGKTAIGIFTGNFESISQIENAVKKGGLLDGVSGAIDFILDKIKKSGWLKNNTIKIIKKGKNTILKGVSSGIKKEFEIENKKVENLNKYNEQWKQAYEEKDFKTMEKNMKKINEILENIMPIENIINESRKIENIHNLIKNNGQNFDISLDQQKLSQLLI